MEPGEWAGLFIQNARAARQVSASTLEAYTLDLAMASRWAEQQQRALVGLTTADLTRYVVERARQGTLPSTIARQLSSLRRFYSFMVSQGGMAVNPAAAVILAKAVRQRPTLVGDAVVRSLLQPPGRKPSSPVSAYRSHRDHAIVCMLYGTSLGISDVRLLRWQQIDGDRQVARVPTRNSEIRTVPLDATLIAALRSLRDFAAAAGFSPESPFCFPTASGSPMTRQALCHLVRKWASERGQEQVVTPSALRRTGRARQFGGHRARPASVPMHP